MLGITAVRGGAIDSATKSRTERETHTTLRDRRYRRAEHREGAAQRWVVREALVEQRVLPHHHVWPREPEIGCKQRRPCPHDHCAAVTGSTHAAQPGAVRARRHQVDADVAQQRRERRGDSATTKDDDVHVAVRGERAGDPAKARSMPAATLSR